MRVGWRADFQTCLSEETSYNVEQDAVPAKHMIPQGN